MQIDMYMAVSADGFIARSDGDSDWVLDDELFEKTVTGYGCIALGHTTFSQYENEIYPMEGIQHIVLSAKEQISKYPNAHFVSSVDNAIAKAQELGFNKLLVIGGAKTNESFMRAGVVKQLFLDVHPLLLGNGIKLLGGYDKQLELKLLKAEAYPSGFVHCEYIVSRGE